MIFAFRADASLVIGSGHVARCLALATGLSKAGHDCYFISHELEGNQHRRVREQGFEQEVIAAEDLKGSDRDHLVGSRGYETWLPCEWREDASHTLRIIQRRGADVLVVDHYALDARWEAVVRATVPRLFVIDDLADREHDCEAIVDQGLDRFPGDYLSLGRSATRLLLGPRYAMLRPEFLVLRAACSGRVRDWPPRQILVNFGGADTFAASGPVLAALNAADFLPSCSIEIVAGTPTSYTQRLQVAAVESRHKVSVVAHVQDMADRMARADIAIGAGGGTSWERACLGLPTLILTVAENQVGVARGLDQRGAAIYAGSVSDLNLGGRLLEGLEELSAPGRLVSMSHAGMRLIDGEGVKRVVRSMCAPPLDVRSCIRSDARQVWLWRNAKGATRFYRSASPVPWSEHIAWFDRALGDSQIHLAMVVQGGESVGHLRFGLSCDETWGWISIYIDPARRGEGLGLMVLGSADSVAYRIGWKRIRAEVHAENAPSRALFEALGYKSISSEGHFLIYERILMR